MSKKVILSDNALQVAKSRYFHNGEDWSSCALRVAQAVASVEKEKTAYTEKFYEMLYNMDFLPGGRILRNAGRPKGSMLNCYVIPIGDSIEEIGQFIKDALTLWSEGGGVGCNFSPLRPIGAEILGKGGESSGLVSFMEAADAVSKTIESGGQRRAAAMGCVDVSHPEILDFINAKLKDGRMSHFNISVIVTDEFLKAVERNDLWPLKFNNREYNKVPAREIWNLVIENIVRSAEPGLLNGTNLYKNNSYYFDGVTSTNPCFSRGTFISTTDGLIPVEELCNKEFNVITDLRSINQFGTYIEKARCFYSGKKTVYRIMLSNKQFIDLTDNHKVYIKEDEKFIKKHVNEIKVGDVMAVQCSISQHFVDPVINKEEYDNGLLVGWRLGDGWITKCIENERNGSDRLQYGFIANNEELEAMEFIFNKIESLKDRDDDRYISNFNPSSGGSKSKELTTSNQKVRKWFSEYGYNCVKNSKTIPNIILTQSKSFKAGFLSGLFSADGNCGNYKNKYNRIISLVSSKKEILQKVQLLLNEFGITSRIGSKHTKLNDKLFTSYTLTLTSSYECLKFMTQITFALSTKKNEMASKFTKTKWHKKDQGEFKIKSIEQVGEEDVYDINTDITHSLIANGILVSNCGEAVLENYGSCCLGSLVLPNFITGTTNTNWQKLERVIKNAIRFLDNVIDVNKYTLKEIDIKGHNSRRIGLGIMGLADYLFMKELRYGSKEALSEIEKLMRFIRDTAYETSIELAVEKGAFPKFDANYYTNASFIRKLPASLRLDIRDKGIRNVTCLSIAPTGTISLLRECSSGIEPLIFKSYKRNDRVGERIYIHPRYKQLLLTGNPIPEWFVDMTDLSPKDHLETQAIVQKYVDGAVSKTINMPHGTTEEELSKLLLEYIKDLKGCTVYIDGSREGQVYNKLTEEEAIEYVMSEMVSNDLSIEDVECNCQKAKDENGNEIEACEIPQKMEN